MGFLIGSTRSLFTILLVGEFLGDRDKGIAFSLI
jgi:hypothetical protein